MADALRLAGDLRRAGLRVEVYPEADKLGKQFKYAAARGSGFVTVVGGDETRRGTSDREEHADRRADRRRARAGGTWLAERASTLEHAEP